MTTRGWGWGILAWVVFTAPAAGQPPKPGKAAFDIEAVKKAWTDRQEKVKSFIFEWTEQTTIPKGRVSRNRPSGGVEYNGDVPPNDLVFPSPRALFMDGEKVRYRYVTQLWWHPIGSAITEEFDSSCDGAKYTSASMYTPTEVTPPMGTVKRLGAHPDLGPLSSRPVMVTLRGTLPAYRIYDPALYEVTGRTVLVNGARCAELVHESRAQFFRSVLLVDPARDFVVVRATRHHHDKLAYQLDTTYTADPVAGWVPASWEHVCFDPKGGAFGSGRCKVTRCEINPKLNDDALTCRPQPGTLMVDVSGATQVKYVVQSDGGAGKKVHRSADVTYQELLAAGPDSSGRPWWRGPGLVFAAVFVGSVGLLGWRGVSRARARRAPTNGTA